MINIVGIYRKKCLENKTIKHYPLFRNFIVDSARVPKSQSPMAEYE